MKPGFLAGIVLLLSPAVADMVVSAENAELVAPMIRQDGVIFQPQPTTLAEGGRAIFTFNVPAAGEYVLKAVVDAPASSANSFFLNIDSPPEDPGMIWDIARATYGFEERIVSWRGSGDMDVAEFGPKVFRLTVGEHKVVIVAREPARLKSIRLIPYQAPGTTPEGTLAGLQQRYEVSDAVFMRERRKLQYTPEGRQQAEVLWKQCDDEHADQFLAAVRLAEANPRSSAGFSALEWVLKTVRSYYHPAGPQAMVLMREQYAQEPAISGIVAILADYFPYPKDPFYPDALALLKAVLDRNPERIVRGRAAWGLAQLDKRRFQEAEWRADPVELARVRKETEQVFEELIRDYGDCPSLRDSDGATSAGTLGEEAGRTLRELRELSIGQVAPEIEAEDLDGLRMKLSDSRGKVVLLVFWAAWCGPCMQDVPHEKELVERFKGRPFVLLGVNADAKRQDAVAAVAEHGILWRSFWEGPDGPRGPIAAAWNIPGWPTIYVLDHHGVIRQKYLRGESLDEPLAKMVAEAESDSPGPAQTPQP